MAEAACLAAIPKSPETLNPFAGYKDDTTGEWVNTGKPEKQKAPGICSLADVQQRRTYLR